MKSSREIVLMVDPAVESPINIDNALKIATRIGLIPFQNIKLKKRNPFFIKQALEPENANPVIQDGVVIYPGLCRAGLSLQAARGRAFHPEAQTCKYLQTRK